MNTSPELLNEQTSRILKRIFVTTVELGLAFVDKNAVEFMRRVDELHACLDDLHELGVPEPTLDPAIRSMLETSAHGGSWNREQRGRHTCRQSPDGPRHAHKCRACGNTWHHQASSANCVACHTCPSCGTKLASPWRHLHT